MFLGFVIRAGINALLLLAAMHIVSRKGSKPDFLTVFYVALGMTFVSSVLLLVLIPAIGFFALVPVAVANVLILMRFLGMDLPTAMVVFVIYQLIGLFLPV